MSEYPLGWQSWSPPPGTFSILPRDYNPLNRGRRPKFSSITPKPPITYWCSWYALGNQLTAENILSQAKLIRKHKLHITHILIDDGWHFCQWLKPLIDELHLLGFKVGIWYAPFTRHKHLPLYPTIENLIINYEIDLIKLDFLYKPYFAFNLHDDTKPHAQLLELFTFLSSNFPSVYTIACGCPFDPGAGAVDAIRVSKDTILPPVFPSVIRRLSYYARMKLLTIKWGLIPSNFISVPDPDVRMFSFDNHQTTQSWSTIHSNCVGIGDKLELLTAEQLSEARIWLKRNLSSRSSSLHLTNPATSPHYSTISRLKHF